MSKPRLYEQLRVVVRDLPCQRQEQCFSGLQMPGGLLGIGRVVWIQKLLEPPTRFVSAYVEGIGIVSVDRQCFAPAD